MVAIEKIFAVLILSAVAAITNGKSLVHNLDQALNHHQNHSATTISSMSTPLSDDNQSKSSGSVLHSRPRRFISYSSAAGKCPVLPETPVKILPDNRMTFFDFRWDQQPSTYPDQSLQCPEKDTAKWEGWTKDNLRAICPWIWVNKVMFDGNSPHEYEIYPKHVKESKCLCRQHCMGKQGMRCRNLWRVQVFYKKVGCDGAHPVFEKHQYSIKVGCYCSL